MNTEMLTRKIGPLPVWGWGAVVAGGLFIGRLIGGGTSGSAMSTTAQGQAANDLLASGDFGGVGGIAKTGTTVGPQAPSDNANTSVGSFTPSTSSSTSASTPATVGVPVTTVVVSNGGGGGLPAVPMASQNVPAGGIDHPVIAVNSSPRPQLVVPRPQPVQATTPMASGNPSPPVVVPTINPQAYPASGSTSGNTGTTPPHPPATVNIGTMNVNVPTAVANLLGAASVAQVRPTPAQATHAAVVTGATSSSRERASIAPAPHPTSTPVHPPTHTAPPPPPERTPIPTHTTVRAF